MSVPNIFSGPVTESGVSQLQLRSEVWRFRDVFHLHHQGMMWEVNATSMALPWTAVDQRRTEGAESILEPRWFVVWSVLSKAFVDAGLNPSPGADEERAPPPDRRVGLIEGPSEVSASGDDDIWWREYLSLWKMTFCFSVICFASQGLRSYHHEVQVWSTSIWFERRLRNAMWKMLYCLV